MKSNSALTYVLFGLLGLFILVAGYYACEKQKKEKELKAQEAAELQETLDNMGYGNDSTAATGSTYANTDSLGKPNTATKPSPTTPTKPITIKDDTRKKITSTAPAKPKPTNKGGKSVKGPGSGRWAVRAGTFAYMEGARRRLEEVIRAGYPNAEISKTNEGKAAVVVFRSNDKDAAIRIADELEEKGFDAAVFDRKN